MKETKEKATKTPRSPRVRKAAKTKEILDTIPIVAESPATVEIIHAPALVVPIPAIEVSSDVPMPPAPEPRREVRSVNVAPKNRVTKALLCDGQTIYRHRAIWNGNRLALETSQAVARLAPGESFAHWQEKQLALN